MLGSTASKVMRVGRTRTLALCVIGLLVTVSIGMVVGVKPAHATEFSVNSLEDEGDDGWGDGWCATEPFPIGTWPNCTLRAAIEEANTDAQSDTITFSSGASGTIALTLGQLTITHDLSIQGPGARKLTVSGEKASRVFFIDAGANPTINVTINGITIRGGNADLGGGIYNRDTLTLTNSTVRGNTATAVSGDSASGQGGGILNSGTLTLRNSTVNGNTADRDGGGIDSINTLTLTNSTVSNNTATNNTPYTFDGGGGILNNGTVTLTNSTISGNTADNGGGIYHLNGTTTIASTIVAGNSASGTGPDVKEQTLGEINSQGFNLIGDVSGSAGWVGSDLLNRNAFLGPLRNNGGPTSTQALKPTSPAINAIPQGTNGCATDVTTDQRGVKRPQGGKCEIGSFEDASPKVTSVVPREGATGVGQQPTIRAFFSEAMKKATITTTTFKLYKVEGTNATRVKAQVDYEATNKEATLTPSAPLEAGATYKAVLTTGVKDLAGNPLDQDLDPSNGNQRKEWSFKVRT